jgi:hypothetical protein
MDRDFYRAGGRGEEVVSQCCSLSSEGDFHRLKAYLTKSNENFMWLRFVENAIEESVQGFVVACGPFETDDSENEVK